MSYFLIFSVMLHPHCLDIVPLAQFFLEKFRKRFRKNDLTIDQQVLAFFQQYEWPGNVRELENAVQRMVITADRQKITVNDLPEKMKAARPAQDVGKGGDPMNLDFAEARKQCLDGFTRKYLVDALRNFHGNISKTAKEIKVQRPSIQRMMKRYEIVKEEYT